MTVTAEKLHDALGASNCEKWWNCPGSPFMEAQCPPQPPNRYAAEGTVAHAVLEAALAGEVFYLDQELGKQYDSDGFMFTVDQEMIDAVNMAIEYVGAIVQRHLLPWSYVMTETKVRLPGNDLDGLPRSGRLDIALHVPYQALYIIDFKYGKGVDVSAEENKQLLNYAAGVWATLSEITQSEIPIIHLVVIQPRRPIGNPINVHSISPLRLQEFIPQLLERIDAVQLTAPLTPGDHCQKYFCTARTTCPALRGQVIAATADFVVEDKPMLPAALALTPEQKAHVLNNKDLVMGFFKAIEDEAMNDLEVGKTVPGYKLVDKVGNLSWTDVAGAAAAAGAEYIYEEKPRTPTQVKAALKKAKIDLDLSPFTWREVKGKTLARDVDLCPDTGNGVFVIEETT